jgi:hypothetical protein
MGCGVFRRGIGKGDVDMKHSIHVDFGAEVDRLFDDSSIPASGQPVAVIIFGAVAVGKTTIRKQKYSAGYVLIDAADIFLSLSQGESLPFPGPLEEPVEIIGMMATQQALSERRHIITEIVGAEAEPVKQLIGALRSIGYEVQGECIDCDIDEACRRNESRGDDNISAYYAEPYQRKWIVDTCGALAGD